MEVKKCARCGNFLTSGDSLCITCHSKDKVDMQKLKNYFEDNENTYSIKELSINTGITEKNLERYMENAEFASFLNLEANGVNNISINL